MSSARNTEFCGDVATGDFPLLDRVFCALIEGVLECEMDELLGYDKHKRRDAAQNYRNGYSRKTLNTQYGKLCIKVPRDRKGEYEPKILPKFKRCDQSLERKLTALLEAYLDDKNIERRIREMYDGNAEGALIRRIQAKLTPILECLQR